MMPRSPPHPTLGHAYRPSAPYPSDSPSAFHGLYNNSSSKKRSRASLSGEAMSNSQSASIDKDLCGAPSHPVTAAGEPSRASASTAKRSRSTNQSEEDLHRDQESFKVRECSQRKAMVYGCSLSSQALTAKQAVQAYCILGCPTRPQ